MYETRALLPPPPPFKVACTVREPELPPGSKVINPVTLTTMVCAVRFINLVAPSNDRPVEP